MPESQSILRTIRKMVGPAEDYTYFDTELIIHINAAFDRLCELGVGPEIPFSITGEEEVWSDFTDDGQQERIKQYVYLMVKVIFDPPQNASVLTSYKESIDKHEWLLKENAAHGY